MRTFRCHKEVQAFKIEQMTTHEADALGTLTRLIGDGQIVEVTDSYIQRHQPNVGGYFVVYEDGYQSFSPAFPFESGYTEIRRFTHPGSPIMKFFDWKHLPAHLLGPSQACADLADNMESTLPPGAEKSAGLRKLLEAKDCFVRALL